MSPAVIDLTSSPEPEVARRKASQTATSGLHARFPRSDDDDAGYDGLLSPGTEALTALKAFKPRKHKSCANTHGQSSGPSFGDFIPLLPDEKTSEISGVQTQQQDRLRNGDRYGKPMQHGNRVNGLQRDPAVWPSIVANSNQHAFGTSLRQERQGQTSVFYGNYDDRSSANDSRTTNGPAILQQRDNHMSSFGDNQSSEPGPVVLGNTSHSSSAANHIGKPSDQRVVPTPSLAASAMLHSALESAAARSNVGNRPGAPEAELANANGTTSHEPSRPFKRRRTGDNTFGSSSQMRNQLRKEALSSLPRPPPAFSISPNSSQPTSLRQRDDSETLKVQRSSFTKVALSSETKKHIKPAVHGDQSVRIVQPAVARIAAKSGSQSAPSSSSRSPSRSPSPELENKQDPTQTGAASISASPRRSWTGYTPVDDALLIRLKEVDRLRWSEIASYFPGRAWTALQSRYSSKLKRRSTTDLEPTHATHAATTVLGGAEADIQSRLGSGQAIVRPQRKKREAPASATMGFVSWADVKAKKLIGDSMNTPQPQSPPADLPPRGLRFRTEHAFPKSASRILRQRELGSDCARSRVATTIPHELKEHLFDDIGPRKYFKGTSGDVTCLAWSPDGKRFAAGSIAVSDERSMQYNRPCNLLIGDVEQGALRELPEHHLGRPDIDPGSGNVEGLHAMRKTQDPRLFMTVPSVGFSPDGCTMYSAGTDRKVRAYCNEGEISSASCTYELEHEAPLDLMSISNKGLIATAAHSSGNDNVKVFNGREQMLSLSPSRQDSQVDRALFPSALKWGISSRHSNFLLAGFSIFDSTDEQRNLAGETCLWDVRTGLHLELNAITRNVFDVAWNPSLSSTATSFAVACSPEISKVNKRTRSVVQCFAPRQQRVARVLEWECPAFDINDVAYCQHDDNLIAVGATDGKVYIWDQRFANRNQNPLHVLLHGETCNVLDEDRERELVDTGVRFLSWGATRSRLYTGSSDGVIKLWNPYRSADDIHVKDVASFDSAVMSGAFSPDYRDLLIGEDQGRINLLSIAHGRSTVRAMQRFELYPAPVPSQKEELFAAARELVESGQIEFRPMGAMQSKRQAVQGPNYHGPYVAPSLEEQTYAVAESESARKEQIQTRLSEVDSSVAADNEVIRAADARYSQAQQAIRLLRSKMEDAKALAAQASATQRAFVLAEQKRLKIDAELSGAVEKCKLDCNYLPASMDDGCLVPDSLRSEARIPGMLRRFRSLEVSSMICEDSAEAGSLRNCITCSNLTAKPKAGRLPQCERCRLRSTGLTASCHLCSAPVRPASDNAGSNTCERCTFACFRCASSCKVSSDVSLVSCETCDLTWEANVLGYGLVKKAEATRATGTSERKQVDEDGGNESGTDHDTPGFCRREMEYYASLWQTKQQ